MMNRTVKPVLSFRNTRWAWTATLAQEQNRIQRRMLAQFSNLKHLPLQSPAKYTRLGLRAVSSLAREQGAWGLLHAQRVVDWAAHLERPRNGNSLAAILYAWHGSDWLNARRRDPDIGGAGRPGAWA